MRRHESSYKRRGPQREPFKSVLIVCEGGKTEPHYLTRLRQVRGLTNANIKITPADGTDPLSVVKFAEAESKRYDFDRVFCVFDRDSHQTYDAALARIATLPKLQAITSWPCFEIWIILHFVYSAAPMERGAAFHAAREHYPAYSKGSKTVFDDLASRLDNAMVHAKRLKLENAQNGSTNPSTQMHELIEYLHKLKE